MADAAACDGGAREGDGVCGEEPEVWVAAAKGYLNTEAMEFS